MVCNLFCLLGFMALCLPQAAQGDSARGPEINVQDILNNQGRTPPEGAASTNDEEEAYKSQKGEWADPGTASEPDDQNDQNRLRTSEGADARDERGEPAPDVNPIEPAVLDEISFGPMQADADGYFKAPATAPVGTLVPVDITYDNRRNGDNLILVRADAPDNAVRGPAGRNMHLIRDADTVYRRAGDRPGIYEIRLRRSNRSIFARQQIELVDLNIDMQVPDAVAAGKEFEVSLNPVMDGHLVITSPDRDPENLVGRNAIRNNTIGDAEGPGVFTRTAPPTTGQYEVRFHFNPFARWGASTDREGRLMARAILNVVDADSIAQTEAVPETAATPSSKPDSESASEALQQRLAEVEARLEALTVQLKAESVNEREQARSEIVELGLIALPLILELFQQGQVDRENTVYILQAAREQAEKSAPATAETAAAETATDTLEQHPSPDAMTEKEIERQLIPLVALLDKVGEDQQADIMDVLSIFDQMAIEIVLDFMQEGLLERGLALRTISAIISADLYTAE